jgi:hypothetical protein
MPSYSGVWSLSQQFQGRGQGLWPQLPGAPTIGTATAGINNCASVAFTAPTCGVPATFTYTATSTPGGITASGAASPLTVTGLTNGTSYTFKVKATNGAGTGPCSAASNSITATVPSCATFTTVGTYSWVVPTGVTSVASVVVSGGGGSGSSRAGDLAYGNSIAVTPGETLTVEVGSRGLNGGIAGTPSRLARGATNLLRVGGGASAGGTARTGGANGGEDQGASGWLGGGGAGGYTGKGGNGPAALFNPNPAGGGAGGGGSGFEGYVCGYYIRGGVGGGGGVGLFGQGTTGTNAAAGSGGGGTGGSGGNSGSGGGGSGPGYAGGGGSGGNYGGSAAAGGYYANCCGCGSGPTGTAASGAVRIVWAGGSRGTPSFPSTNVGP